MVKYKLSIIFLMLIGLSSCATMFNGGNQSVLLKPSNGKENIMIEVTTSEGNYKSTLPDAIVSESSNEGIKVRVIDRCYENTSTSVGKWMTPSFFANTFNGGIGFIIDYATGKMWKYDNVANIQVVEKSECRR